MSDHVAASGGEFRVPEPRTEAGLAGLQALITRPSEAIAAFDFDGTLSAIVEDPARSRAVDGALDALRALADLGVQIAVVTGRAAATAVELGGLQDVPGIVVAGQYGAERWAGGELHIPQPPDGVGAVRLALPDLLADADPGVWVEDKVLSLVVHTRRAADPVGALARLRAPVRALAERHALEANPGRNVLEIRIPGFDKGGALTRLVSEFDRRTVLFAGDDLGDIPAFDAVETMRANGLAGVTVCSASAEAEEVAQRADMVVDGPAGVVNLLRAIVAAAQPS